MKFEDVFLAELLDAIETNTLVLPSLPEVALKIRQTLEEKDVSIAKLATVIGQDIGLSAKLIRFANSPLVRTGARIESLQTAISRMGLTYVKNLAMGLALEQSFHSPHQIINQRLRVAWANGLEVASIANVLAHHFTNLSADQATLAGLTHEIGILPILTMAERYPELGQQTETLEHIIRRLHPVIGKRILQNWEFAPEIAEIPTSYLDFRREPDSADLCDLITVAVLQSSLNRDTPLAKIKWDKVGAFERLGLSTEVDNYDLSAEVRSTRELFS